MASRKKPADVSLQKKKRNQHGHQIGKDEAIGGSLMRDKADIGCDNGHQNHQNCTGEQYPQARRF